MDQEKRNCQNCKNQFVIESEDFDFYKKIDVPPPTWCPECRVVRRFILRNERTMYRKECGLCGKNTLSVYSGDFENTMYCHECWISDKWDPLEYGVEYDFSKSFFEQYKKLLKKVPLRMVFNINIENSPYTNYTAHSKNVFMSFSALHSENIFFSKNLQRCFWNVDCFDVNDSENCYEVIESEKNYNSMFLYRSRNSMDSMFLFDCVNCKDCILSSNLRNKQYIIRNKQCKKEEYEKEKQKILSGSYSSLQVLIHEYRELIKNSIHKFSQFTNTQNCVGDNLINSKNAQYCFNSDGVEDVRYGFRIPKTRDSYDLAYSGPNIELMYEFIGGGNEGGRKTFFVAYGSAANEDCVYGQFLNNSSHLFGCVGLTNKQYCILNKQYTKEEYEVLLKKIKQHMFDMPYIDQKGRVYTYGEFFPPELSPLGYNETIAQEYFPLTKEQALAQGFSWKDPDTKNYTITKKPDDLPDSITEVSDSITDEVIGCVHAGTCTHQCTTAFKIIPQELEFYRRMHLPLPRLCPNCRHYERLAQRNPLKLWKRLCMCDKSTHQHEGVCPNEFETSYAPERKEIVYCEQCYQAEVV
ncbi:MAG: hypothetical protein AB1333_03835 [Patescibacteria group bacterium]